MLNKQDQNLKDSQSTTTKKALHVPACWIDDFLCFSASQGTTLNFFFG
jgi:hypothetical protein